MTQFVGMRRRAAVFGRRCAVVRAVAAALVVALGYQLYLPGASAAEPSAPVVDVATNAPASRVYYMTPEQFEAFEPQLKAHGFQCLTNSVGTNAVANVTIEQPPPVPESGTGADAYEEPVEADTPPRGGPADGSCDLVGNLIVELIDTDWASSDAAVVIFVVIGVAVVLTVVVYAGVYLYEIVTGTGNYRHWWQIEPRFESVSGGASRGQLAGVKLSAGFEREASDMRTGLIVESGYMNLHVQPEDGGSRVRAEGGYLMAGAGIQWLFGRPQNPSSLGFELMAGVADDRDVDIVSVARANLGFGISTHGRLGLSVGALLVGLDPEDGLLENHNQFIPLIGLETGIRF